MRSPISLDAMAAAARPATEAIGLPPACYTDPAFYEFELRAVFDHEWMCVGRASQIPEPGDYFTTTLVGHEPIIVARNREGEVNVMSSICAHRAMCITAPATRPRDEWFAAIPECSGNTRTFRCPYHWWTYDLDGRLIGAPEMHRRPGFTRSDISLASLTVEEWQGFIFCSFSPDALPLGPRLASFDKILEPYHLAEMVTTAPEIIDLPFNWKVMSENTMDAYHSARLHADLYDFDGAPLADESLISGDFPSLEPTSAGMGGIGRAAFRDRGMNPTQKALFPPLADLTEEDRWNVAFLFIPPTLIIAVHSDSAQWLSTNPSGPASSVLRTAYLFPRSTREMKLFDQLFDQHRRGMDLFFDQDMPVGYGNQLGMGSRYATQGPLSHQDFLKSQFAEWLFERYRAVDASAPPVD